VGARPKCAGFNSPLSAAESPERGASFTGVRILACSRHSAPRSLDIRNLAHPRAKTRRSGPEE
jgi:hypothetical protein